MNSKGSKKNIPDNGLKSSDQALFNVGNTPNLGDDQLFEFDVSLNGKVQEPSKVNKDYPLEPLEKVTRVDY